MVSGEKTMKVFSAGMFLMTVLTAALSVTQQRVNDSPSVKPAATFVELGSVKCIPCRQMQPVMKAIEEKFGSQIKVVFHDVWTEQGKPYAGTYKIRLIPTQVFLDADGKEFFRHEGFFPEAEIVKILQKRGLTEVRKEK
jgi:thioredoxin 1